MDEWLKSFGPGKFTFGAKYICFLPEGARGHEYVRLAQAMPDQYDDPRWMAFAERVTDYLNELREIRAGE